MEFIANSIFSEGPNKNFPEFLLSPKMKSKTKPIIYLFDVQCVWCVRLVSFVRKWDWWVFE